MWTEMSDPAILAKLGARIREIRIRSGIQQGELARNSGVSTSTISKIEKGESVSNILFISVLRSLGLLENMEFLVPETKISPIVLKKMQGRKLYRVRRLKNNSHE